MRSWCMHTHHWTASRRSGMPTTRAYCSVVLVPLATWCARVRGTRISSFGGYGRYLRRRKRRRVRKYEVGQDLESSLCGDTVLLASHCLSKREGGLDLLHFGNTVLRGAMTVLRLMLRIWRRSRHLSSRFSLVVVTHSHGNC
jgi:hypothetical protein